MISISPDGGTTETVAERESAEDKNGDVLGESVLVQ